MTDYASRENCTSFVFASSVDGFMIVTENVLFI